MKRYHTATIARLLERYMAGTTTLSEERLLERYFRTATDIPGEWRVYQAMFTQYAPVAKAPARHTVRPALRWVAAVSVAVVCALAVWLWMSPPSPSAGSRPLSVAHPVTRPAVVPRPSSSVVRPSKAVSTLPKTTSAPLAGTTTRPAALATRPSTPTTAARRAEPPSPAPRQAPPADRPQLAEAPLHLSAKPVVPISPMLQLQDLAHHGYASLIDDLAQREAAEDRARDLLLVTALVASGEVPATDVLADLAAGVSPANLFIESI